MTLEEKFDQRIWDVLQAIWKAYNSANKKNEVYVFVKYLKIKERTIYQINDVMETLRNKGCFDRWSPTGTWFDDSYYVIHNINSEKLAEVYQQTKIIYENFAKNYKERQEKENIKTVNFEPPFAPVFDGRSISVPSIEEVNREKDSVRRAARRLLDKLKLKEEIKKEIREENNNKQDKTENILIAIKNICLDERNYLLEINSGEKILSFKRKKGGSKLEKETKVFKVLYHLWDFHRETKGDKILEEGNYALLENIKIGSGCLTKEATYQHIKRLNTRFQEENLPIHIEGKDEKYLLVINKT